MCKNEKISIETNLGRIACLYIEDGGFGIFIFGLILGGLSTPVACPHCGIGHFITISSWNGRAPPKRLVQNNEI